MFATVLTHRVTHTVAAWVAVSVSFPLGAPLAVSLTLGAVFAVTGFRMMHAPDVTAVPLPRAFLLDGPLGRHAAEYRPETESALPTPGRRVAA